jgi:hypothetical protein
VTYGSNEGRPAYRRGRHERHPDVAVWPTGAWDLVAFVTALARLVDHDRIDVLDLSRAGVVARGLALERCEPLYERTPGLFARHQMAALPPLADTAWIRDLALDTLATP